MDYQSVVADDQEPTVDQNNGENANSPKIIWEQKQMEIHKFKNKQLKRELLLWDTKSVSKLFVDLKIFNIDVEKDEQMSQLSCGGDEGLRARKDGRDEEKSDSISLNSNSCSVCGETFTSLVDQRQHFKLDWHRYNLKRKLQGQSRISEEVFNKHIEDNPHGCGFTLFERKDSEVSDCDTVSLSGSESDEENLGSEDGESDSYLSEARVRQLRHPRIFLESVDNIFSIFKCILPDSEIGMGGSGISKEINDSDLLTSIHQLPKRLNWAIFMLGGGHFAGAVFNGDQVLTHKTFHCYTVRKKQGGGQSSADNKSGTNHPKSAGASLRRYNEASLGQHVRDILDAWNSDYLSKCHLIFYRAASGNKRILFGSVTGSHKVMPVLLKDDPRIRTIPFPTRRATLKEVKRVHQLLSTVQIHGNKSDIVSSTQQLLKKEAECNDSSLERKHRSAINDLISNKSPTKKGGRNIRRSKSRDSPNRQLPDFVQMLAEQACTSENNSDSNELPNEVNLQFLTTELSTATLKEYDSSFEKDKRKRKKNKSHKSSQPQKDFEPAMIGENEVSEDEIVCGLTNDLATACKVGNQKLIMETILAVQDLVELAKNNEETAYNHERFITNMVNVKGFLNAGFGGNTTALHVASQCGHKQIIATLLDHGADPTIKDKQKKTAYNLAPDRDARNVFRRFQAKWPERYDWSAASVPTSDLLTPEEEARQEEKRREKRKAQRQAKKEKETLIKQQKGALEKEQHEREAFLRLSDREKRALAAERRIIAAKTADTTNADVSMSAASLTGLSIQRCFQCAKDITGKVPFEYENYRFCTTSCVKEHRKKVQYK